MTNTQKLYALLRDGRWYRMSTVQKAGGWRYGARLHNLRSMGCVIETKKMGGCWYYRLTGGTR